MVDVSERQPAVAADEERLQQEEEKLARGLLVAWRRIIRQLDDLEVRRLLQRDDPRKVMEEELRRLFTEVANEGRVRSALMWGFREGVRRGAEQLPDPFAKAVLPGKAVRDILSREEGASELASVQAVRRARQLAGRFEGRQATGIRNVVRRMLMGDLNLDSAQRIIRQVGVGLDDRYAQAVMNRHRSHMRRLRSRHPNWKSSTIRGRANARAKEYSAELREARARRIARTEVMRAHNEGRDLAWRQARKAGQLPEGAQKRWETHGAVDYCAGYDGETVAIGDRFAGGDPPLHPNCRCTIELEV